MYTKHEQVGSGSGPSMHGDPRKVHIIRTHAVSPAQTRACPVEKPSPHMAHAWTSTASLRPRFHLGRRRPPEVVAAQRLERREPPPPPTCPGPAGDDGA
jgi:hypothetical protein